MKLKHISIHEVHPIENIKNLIKLNGFGELIDNNIFKKFEEIKNIEHRAEKKIFYDALSEESKKEYRGYTEEQKKTIKKLNNKDKLGIWNINNTLSRVSYYGFFKLTFTTNNPLVLGRHIELICDILTLAEMGLFKGEDTKTRIAISVPPRHLKSTSITNSYPSWFMAKATFRNTIVTSYGDNLVQKAGQKNREKINELCGALFGAKLKKDVGKKSEWELEGGGRFKGATIRGGATGEGAELLIIDDPVKNREEANSKTIQEKVWGEYTDTYLTRLHNNGILINIMTRWHNSDLRGKIDEHEHGLKWLKVDLSAICETEEEAAEDPLGRKVGEALYPQMYGVKYFEPFKMNPRTWWSLYKQKPQVDNGEYFSRDYFQYFEFDEHFVTLYTEVGPKKFLVKDCWIFQTIDTAQKDHQENDETALLTIAVTPENDLLYLDLYHGRIKVPDQEKVITQYWNKWDCQFQAIEDKQSGTGIIQKLVIEGRPVKALKAVGDKIERSTTAQIFYANNKIFHLKGAEWVGVLEKQLLEFPVGKNDDIVDVSSYAAIVVSEQSGISSVL